MTHPIEQNTLLHQAFFWLKRPGNVDDRKILIKGLETLRDIPQVKFMRIHVPAETEARDVVDSSWDALELMLFDSLADQKIYQGHPIHQAFIETCGALWDRVVVYDAIPAVLSSDAHG